MTREIVRAAHRLRARGHVHVRTGVCPLCRECDHRMKVTCLECGVAAPRD